MNKTLRNVLITLGIKLTVLGLIRHAARKELEQALKDPDQLSETQRQGLRNLGYEV